MRNSADEGGKLKSKILHAHDLLIYCRVFMGAAIFLGVKADMLIVIDISRLY